MLRSHRLAPVGLVVVLLCLCGGRDTHGEEEPKKKPPAPKPISLRVVSYNAWLIPLFSKEYEQRKKRLPDALASFDAQVLCLQEVWTQMDQEELCKALAKSHPHSVPAKGGLLVLSTYPVASSAFTRYPDDEKLAVQERAAGKGYLSVMLTTPAGPLEVVTTHLAAMWGKDNPRERQLDLLVGHLQKERAHALILAGDLNTTSVRNRALTAGYKKLLAGGLSSANPPTKQGDGPIRAGPSTRVGWPRVEGKKPVGWVIDHILFRAAPKGVMKRLSFRLGLDTPKTALSDHQLLLAELRIEPPAQDRQHRDPSSKDR